jgi:hypothetical protein
MTASVRSVGSICKLRTESMARLSVSRATLRLSDETGMGILSDNSGTDIFFNRCRVASA